VKLQPFVRVDDTLFSATQQDVVDLRGEPSRPRLRNAVGLHELDYGEVIFRFQDNGRLEEITKLAPVLFIGAQTLLFPSLAAFVRDNDASLFERAGFLVSPRFGIAFDPGCPSWVTALARHCLDTWRSLQGATGSGRPRSS
jgi:hypothetical protein